MLTDGESLELTEEAPANRARASHEEATRRVLIDSGNGPRRVSAFVVLNAGGDAIAIDGDNPTLERIAYRKQTGAIVFNEELRLVVAILERNEEEEKRQLVPLIFGDTMAEAGPIGLLAQIDEAYTSALLGLVELGSLMPAADSLPSIRARFKSKMREISAARFAISLMVAQQFRGEDTSRSGIVPGRPLSYTERLEQQMRGRR